MSAPKRKAPAMKAKQPESVNKKMLVWWVAIFGVILIAMILLLIFT
ncbi:hypothetical protein DFQ01_11311 [Paenibacillus cellulosilyticus]|uniref:Uncharacterized protein n=1 Tax=Paenibacillus cellulosilyticus TaxID=375489 RepID=A0A2V2YR12_9BACL|nr:hypothetical protein [Paenibacillus cellulosilyticus]PWV99639.1 hypothetical protein DFQ01_11311 [Paenibacillus cellulosilyticus]QKS44920.1 hypothetical protein HUB94_11230 [Paenibacillus cellulosilyticus]